MSETNVPGFYAAGDVSDTEWKQAVVGVAEGTKAAYMAYEFVSKQKAGA
jgi:thioredoxin reductase